MSRFYGFYYLATRIAEQDGRDHADPAKRDAQPEANAGHLLIIVAIPIVIVAALLLIFTV